jgi:hypothetical protein
VRKKIPISLWPRPQPRLLAANISDAGTPASGRYLTIDKVLVLKNVRLFKAIPDEILAGIATLLSERWVDAGRADL